LKPRGFYRQPTVYCKTECGEKDPADLCDSQTEELHQRSIEVLKFTGEVLVVSSQGLILN